MKAISITVQSLAITAILVSCMTSSVIAQQVSVQLSSNEAYVGQPLLLQISISNASDYEVPKLPAIDGCDIRSAGNPSQSSQISIINGRRSESRSVVMQYFITPKREGTFVIPPFVIEVDGQKAKSSELRFVATKSETGDLLFVEIEGAKQKVYVGQQLDLKLKIWIKPFVDRQKNIKLTEAHMWQLISEQTSWGSFAAQLQKMAENRQRPAGREVLRDDGSGKEGAYYLYDIEGSTYPKRPGKIEADDVNIIVNYPTALGKSRDPFESMFGDSPLSRLMDDDFFGGSPFANRLTVTATRPVVGQAEVGSTIVVPVPEEGRPADYRGAVGQYQILTQATPTQVSAGDPINLQIGIVGDGPLDLVQAPPLAELPELTRDFKVDDALLAGFVKEDVKVFPTTIRPRKDGITSIPSIPFSYFNPDTETFHTVRSQPIAISVDPAESLALDSIVGKSRTVDQDHDGLPQLSTVVPDLTQRESEDLLTTELSTSSSQIWLVVSALSPLIWLLVWVVYHYNALLRRLGRWSELFYSRSERCCQALVKATTKLEIDSALLLYLADQLRIGDQSSATQVLGAVRLAGMYSLAAELEAFLDISSQENNSAEANKLEAWRQQARDLVVLIDRFLGTQSLLKVRGGFRPKDRNPLAKSTGLLLISLIVLSSPKAVGGQDSAPEIQPINTTSSRAARLDGATSTGGSQRAVELSRQQQMTILSEASRLYGQAHKLEKDDRAEAQELFSRAAEKYQLLVDSGIRNSSLYFNLANAYLQNRRMGLAIGNYERAKQIDPADRQVLANWQYAKTLVPADPQAKVSEVSSRQGRADLSKDDASPSMLSGLQSLNRKVIQRIGAGFVRATIAVASVWFWGILTLQIIRPGLRAKPWSILPLLLLLTGGSMMLLQLTDPPEIPTGFIVANVVELRSGDGEHFESLARIDQADGQPIRVLDQRRGWCKVETTGQRVGWIKDTDCLIL